jgi:Flp pilus assembly protein TadG
VRGPGGDAAKRGGVRVSRRHDDDGANAVEFALVLPILLVLVFGIMWGGIAFEQNLAISHAAREGARFGATLNVTTTGSVDTTELQRIRDRAEAASAGRLGGSETYVCVAYVESAATNYTERVTNGGTRTASAPTVTNSCYDDGIDPSEPRIQVYVERDAILDFIFYGGTIRLDAAGVSYYEHDGLAP